MRFDDHRSILQGIARRVMLEHDLLPDFSPEAMVELGRIQDSPAKIQNNPGGTDSKLIRDLRKTLWASIDNDDSRDLDQLTVAEEEPDGKVKIMVAIAEVESLVKNDSALDVHARHNTTSVYTVAEIFPMLPEKLSTDLTSLNFNEDRLAIVVEAVVAADGSIQESNIYKAWVRNHAKLAYSSVGAWLEKKSEIPEPVAAVAGLAENLQMQDRAAQGMKKLRYLHGALSLETIEAKPVFDGNQIRSLDVEEKNRAKELIEDFMIAANGITARYLSARKYPSIRRVVRVPKRWDRIVEIAGKHKFKLPDIPDSKALEEFLVQEKAADPVGFPDLSLVVIKLLGSGEYVAQPPGGDTPGHFGLAVKDYAHSTAPNRRYPDLLTQRLLIAALGGKATPYSMEELNAMAAHFTEAEDAANAVERQVAKSAAALLLQSRVGEQFNSIVTGASEVGTWVRLLDMPIEGKLVAGFAGLDVGDRIRVQLIDTNVERGYIDFKNVGSPKPG